LVENWDHVKPKKTAVKLVIYQEVLAAPKEPDHMNTKLKRVYPIGRLSTSEYDIPCRGGKEGTVKGMSLLPGRSHGTMSQVGDHVREGPVVVRRFMWKVLELKLNSQKVRKEGGG